MRVTVDTNFLVSSTQWDYSVSCKLLRKLIEKDVEIFTTREILEEFSEVLQRDFKYSSEETEKIIEKTFPILTLVEIQGRLKVIQDDPDDDKIVECALVSSSNYIITYDKHLLNIREYEDIKIIKPEEALQLFEL